MKSIFCKLRIHNWGNATFFDSGFHSSVRDYKQDCIRCHKRITWVQPKKLDVRFYPTSWFKKQSYFVWIIILFVTVYALILYIFKS